MIERRLSGDRATLHEFALYFIASIGEMDDDERQEAAQVLGAILERNLDIQSVTLLGAGFFGAAARHRNHVLKLTSDQTEAPAANQLVGLKLRHVVRFYQSAVIEGFSMIRAGGSRMLPVGIIFSEKLDNMGLNDRQDDLLSRIVSDTKRDFGVFDLDWEDLTADEARDLICDASVALEERLFAEEGSIREVALGLEELRSHDVCLIDTHAKNVGYDQKGVHKIFDVGLASSPADRVPRMAGRARSR